MFKRVIIGLGSNLADPDRAVLLGWRCVAHALSLRDSRLSSLYSSRPAEGATGARFTNAVGLGHTRRDPAEVLALLHGVEDAFGRARDRESQGRQRPLDLDLLDHGGLCRDEMAPMLPHPRLTERDFVLAPLAEIAADFVHGPSGLGVADLLARLPQVERTLSWPEVSR